MANEKLKKAHLQALIDREITIIKKLARPQIGSMGNFTGRIPAGLEEVVGSNRRGYRIRRRYGFISSGNQHFPQYRISYLVTPRLEMYYCLLNEKKFKSFIGDWIDFWEWYNAIGTGRN